MKYADQNLLLKNNPGDVFNERDGNGRLQAARPLPADFVFRIVGQAGQIHELEQLSREFGPLGSVGSSSGDCTLWSASRLQARYQRD